MLFPKPALMFLYGFVIREKKYTDVCAWPFQNISEKQIANIFSFAALIQVRNQCNSKNKPSVLKLG